MQNVRALRDIEFKNLTPLTLTPLTVLPGPNGSGKSTMFDVLMPYKMGHRVERLVARLKRWRPATTLPPLWPCVFLCRPPGHHVW